MKAVRDVTVGGLVWGAFYPPPPILKNAISQGKNLKINMLLQGKNTKTQASQSFQIECIFSCSFVIRLQSV